MFLGADLLIILDYFPMVTAVKTTLNLHGKKIKDCTLQPY